MTLTIAGDKYHQTVSGTVNERGTIQVDARPAVLTIKDGTLMFVFVGKKSKLPRM